MAKRITVGILFGGRSSEHEVSLQSARNIVEAIDRNKYDVVLIGIDKTGHWRLAHDARYLLNSENPRELDLSSAGDEIVLAATQRSEGSIMKVNAPDTPFAVDVIFPILHGTYGEDGTIQGLLKLADIPFVGAGVLGSAVGMDKDVAKRLWKAAGINVVDSLVVKKHNRKSINFEQICNTLGLPLFIKPANAGSSVGVSKATNKESFERGVEEAFSFDSKILIEAAVTGREIEVAILGNEAPQASVPGEIIPKHEFYSYDAKYLDPNGADLKAPADLSPALTKTVQDLAVKAFQTIECEGMARVDFFLTNDNQFLINEINTIPGFTKISMYPRLWELSGVSYPELINRLIQLAIERSERDRGLKTTRQ